MDFQNAQHFHIATRCSPLWAKDTKLAEKLPRTIGHLQNQHFLAEP